MFHSTCNAGFDAWKVVTSAMEECGNFTPTLDQDYKDKMAALDSNPSLLSYDIICIYGILVHDAGLTEPLDRFNC